MTTLPMALLLDAAYDSIHVSCIMRSVSKHGHVGQNREISLIVRLFFSFRRTGSSARLGKHHGAAHVSPLSVEGEKGVTK